MALTRKFLESFGLSGSEVDTIIAAHAQTVDALKEQRDGFRAQAEQSAAEAARVQAEHESFKLRHRKASALRGALREAGVQREEFAELLLKAADIDAVDPDNPGPAVEGLRSAYGGCFSEVRTPGVPVIAPPSGGRISPDDLRGMSVREINDHWEAVKAALRGC